MPVMITLGRILACKPCEDGWEKVLDGRGKNPDYEEEFPLIDCFYSNNFRDVVWALQCVPNKYSRAFAVGCARLAASPGTEQFIVDAFVVAESFYTGFATTSRLKEAHKVLVEKKWRPQRDACYHAARCLDYTMLSLLSREQAAMYAFRASQIAVDFSTDFGYSRSIMLQLQEDLLRSILS